MKVKVGDNISSEFGTGKIVAMTKEWCIHVAYPGEETEEVAVPWDETWIPSRPEPEQVPDSSIDEMDVQPAKEW